MRKSTLQIRSHELDLEGSLDWNVVIQMEAGGMTEKENNINKIQYLKIT